MLQHDLPMDGFHRFCEQRTELAQVPQFGGKNILKNIFSASFAS